MVMVAALGVAAVLLALQFKSGKPEYGMYIGMLFWRRRTLPIARYLRVLSRKRPCKCLFARRCPQKVPGI